jgi:D-beta-D-heptose 7-phosphate kinase / D-beta-D-heptose 1-phosphate adenosyltransferase
MQTDVLPNFNKRRILVLGDVMLDRYLMGEVKRISPEAPVPVLRVKERYEVLGGAGNVANNLAKLGCRTLLLGVVGVDPDGESVRKLCEQLAIDNHLITEPHRPTITKTRVIAREQQLLRLDEEETDTLGNTAREELLARFEEELPSCQAVIFSDYGKGIFQTPDFCQSLLTLAGKQAKPIFVDPKGRDWDRYRGATCITPNVQELELVAGISAQDGSHLIRMAEEIRLRHQAEWLLVTRGAKGMCLLGPQEMPLVIPTVAREVYDVSGAGDTVIATLAACIAANLSFPQAARVANAAAGVVVGKLGTQPITAAELQNALRLEESANGLRHTSKFSSLGSAQIQVQNWKSNGDKVVFTNGCFDLLHPGYVHLLEEAKALGDRLVVGLNADASVKRLKGPRRPILSENDRVALLRALSCVDLVVLFEEDTPIKLIKTLRPDILVKGSDYDVSQVVGREIVESYGGQVALVNLLDGYSTTRIAERMAC